MSVLGTNAIFDDITNKFIDRDYRQFALEGLLIAHEILNDANVENKINTGYFVIYDTKADEEDPPMAAWTCWLEVEGGEDIDIYGKIIRGGIMLKDKKVFNMTDLPQNCESLDNSESSKANIIALESKLDYYRTHKASDYWRTKTPTRIQLLRKLFHRQFSKLSEMN